MEVQSRVNDKYKVNWVHGEKEIAKRPMWLGRINNVEGGYIWTPRCWEAPHVELGELVNGL